VQVAVAVGASEPAGQVAADSVPEPLNAPSLTVIACKVTLPVFFTANE
jgi:hypothetical protein